MFGQRIRYTTLSSVYFNIEKILNIGTLLGSCKYSNLFRRIRSLAARIRKDFFIKFPNCFAIESYECRLIVFWLQTMRHFINSLFIPKEKGNEGNHLIAQRDCKKVRIKINNVYTFVVAFPKSRTKVQSYCLNFL